MTTQTKQLQLLLKQEQKDLAKIRAIQKKVSGESYAESDAEEFEHVEMEE